MKKMFNATFCVALVFILSSFTNPTAPKPAAVAKHNKTAKRFPLGSVLGYFTATSGYLTGSFRLVADINDRSTLIYMVSTVTNGYYVVSGTYDKQLNLASVYYKNYNIYGGNIGNTPGTLPPSEGVFPVE
jgi:hypothetical protein